MDEPKVQFSAGSDDLVTPRGVRIATAQSIKLPQAAAHTNVRHLEDVEEEAAYQMHKSKEKMERFQVVFAATIEVEEDFVAPVHSKTEAQEKTIRAAIASNFVFDNLEEKEMKTLVGAFEKFTAQSGDAIIKQGDIGDFFYIIESGEVEFTVAGNKVGTAGADQSFGELALLYDSPRAATCTATNTCDLWRVDQNTFRKIMASNTMKSDKETKDILRKVPFLADLSEVFLNKINDALTTVHFKQGGAIFKKGDEGDVFYIVKDGKVKITDIEVGSVKYDDQTLSPGDYFGERAIVTKEKRVANVTAVEDTTALCLTRDDFLKHLGNLSDLVIKSADKRKLAGIPLFIKAVIEDHEMDTLVGLLKDATHEKGEAFFMEGTTVEPAIYLVRSGKVKITSEGNESILTNGAYFGEDTIQPDSKSKEIVSTMTAIAEETATVSVLTLSDIEKALGDISRLSSKEALDKRDKSINMSDLDKHRILGVGTFGQVWLVTQKDKAKDEAYALKIQVKRELLNHQQVNGVIREKDIMAGIDHPFIIKLVNTYQDDRCIYMLLRLVQGGELFSVLHTDISDGVPEKAAMFYSAGILEGLSYMHRRKILYRDLKPENVLIDAEGYTVIVDLGFAKVVPDKTYTLCGTPLYLAPEVILSRGHDKGADYWSWGVLLFEMVVGQCPFYEPSLDQVALFKMIVKGQYDYPPWVKPTDGFKDLVQKTLVKRSTDRLGSFCGADKDIREHSWFADFEFDKLLSKEITAPWKPKIKDALDSSNFDNWENVENQEVDPDEKPLSADEQGMFKGF